MSDADRGGGWWEPTPPVPDTVPGELVERYGKEARRVATTRASRLGRWWRSWIGDLSGEELWTTTAVVFAVLLVGLVLLGGLVVAAVLWPLWTAALAIPIPGLGLVSLLVARRLVRTAEGPEDGR